MFVSLIMDGINANCTSTDHEQQNLFQYTASNLIRMEWKKNVTKRIFKKFQLNKYKKKKKKTTN